MNRTWLAVILGVLLGFVLMGMMLRGCEVGANTNSGARPEAAMAPSSRLASRIVAAPEPRVDIRSTFETEALPTPATRSRFIDNADGRRNSAQRLTQFADQPDSEFALAQQLAQSRAQRGNQNALADNAAVIGEAQRRQQLLNRGTNAATAEATANIQQALQARSLAESELLQQIERERQRQSAEARRQALEDGVDGDTVTDETGLDGESGDNANDVFFDEQTRAGNVTINSPGFGTPNPGPIGGGGDNGGNNGNGGDGDGDGDGEDPIDETPIGGGDGDGDGDGDSDGPDVPPIVIPPIDGGGGNPGAGPAVIAKWAPVEVDDSCNSLTGTRTNDLYLGFNSPWGLQIVTSAPPVSLGIVGGSFRQDASNGNTLPTAQTLELFPCAAFDSYLAIGEANGVFLPTPLDPANWGQQLNAVWVTPTSQPFGSVGVRDSARFGDDRYYVRIGRFTASGNPEFVGGTLVVNAFNLAAFSVQTAFVEVPHEPDIWAVQGGASVGLVSYELSVTSVLSGEYVIGTVTLSQPAPDGGVQVTFDSSNSAVQTPSFIIVPEGATTASFLLPTSVVFTSANVTLSASLNATTVFANLVLQAQPTDELLKSVTLEPNVVRGRMTATGRITLGSAAPAGGRTVYIGSDNYSVANVPTNVYVPEGETEATFEIETGVVAASQYVEIWAVVQDQIRTATLTVTILGDIDGDGLVNGADLAQLLARWETDDEIADMNGDGVVNGADIADLLANFNGSTTPTGTPPFSGSVLARWVPVQRPDTCGELAGTRTNDLYIGFQQRPAVPGGPVITSGSFSQVFMTGGDVHQNAAGGNAPPSNAFLSLLPCLAYDSYLTVGGASPTFFPGQVPDAADWGEALDAGWFTTEFNAITIEQNAAKFGDSKFYVLVGRFTAAEGIRIDGELQVDYTSGGVSQPTALVTVAQCPVCWISFDLNEDGAVDAGDVEYVMARIGADDSTADLDRDGFVTGRDLELIVDEATSK